MSSYTPEQWRAIHDNANLVVTAGAGAGKTRVLTQRWLRLVLQEGAALDQVVAITFTEKAAAEMRERCRTELTSAAAAGDLRAAALLDRLDEARISTFHSFCQSLLRLYPVEAAVDPEFAVADDLAAATLLDEAIEECLLAATATADEAVVDLLTRFGRTRLAGHLARLIGQMRNLGETPASLRAATTTAATGGADISAVAAAVDALLAHPTKEGSAGRTQQIALRETWAALQPRLAAGIPPELLADLLAMAGAINGRSLPPKPALVTALEGLANGAAARVGLAVIDLMERALDNYERRKEQANLLDFPDLIERLRRLLAEAPAVRADLVAQGLIFLNDEVQDTDPSQWAIIRQLLTVPGGDAEIPPGRVFIVGDPKQSIYRFRGARVEIFGEVTADVAPTAANRVGLLKNFRSQQGLIDLVNALFRQLMDPAAGPGAVSYAPMEAHRPAAPATAELLLSASPGAAGRQEEAALIATRLQELVATGTVRYGEIAVLMQAMTHARTYETALAAAGIPCYVVAGDGFFQREEIADLDNLLRLLNDAGDAIALAGWLRSPHVGLSDNAILAMGLHTGGFLAAWADPGFVAPAADAPLLDRARRLLPRLRSLAWQEPLPRLLPALYAELQLYPVLLAEPDGAGAVANLEKLAAMVSQFAGQGRHQFPDLLRWLRTARDAEAREGLAATEEEGGNSIRIMTVHKAKGLEFPVVVLPDCGRTMKPDAAEILLHPQVGVVPKLTDGDGEEIKSELRRRAADLGAAEAEQEFRRLFYVGATRARDYLLLSAIRPKPAANGDGKATWLHWLCGVCGADPADPPAALQVGTVTIPVRIASEAAPAVATAGVAATVEIDAAAAPPAPLSPAAEAILRQIAPVPRPAAPADLATSASRLMVFQDCPRKYYLQTALALPDLRRAPVIGADPAADARIEPTERGHIVHAVCERLTDPADLEALIVQALAEAGVDQAHPDVEPSIREPLRRFVGSDLFRRIQAAEAAHSELAFGIATAGFALEGFIDKVLVEPDGVVVIDFKTNNVTTPTQIEEAAAHYALQMQIYAAAVAERLGRPVTEALLYFLTPGVARSITPDAAGLHATLSAINSTLRTANDWAEFPANPDHCGKCQYQRFCGYMHP